MGSVTLPESLLEKLRKLKEVRDDQDVVVKKINKFHSRLSETTREKAEKYSDKLWQKLREYYANAKKLAELEERLCAQCAAEIEALSQPTTAGIPASTSSRKKTQGIGDVRKSKVKQQQQQQQQQEHGSAGASGTSQPSHQRSIQGPRKGTEAPSPLAVPGEMVAARVSPKDAEKDDWIVVKVLTHDSELNTYEVIDEEPGDEDEPGPRKYKLDASCIIPFPKTEALASAPEFATGSHVLAVYPGTTSLYRATVAAGGQPRKNKDDDYSLEFDDDEEEGVDGLPQRPVPFHHVVPLPSGHRQ